MKRFDLALVIAAACLWMGSATPGLADGAPPPVSNAAAATAAASTPAPSTPAPTPTAPPAPPTSAPASQAVVLYIAPEISDRKWSKASPLFRPIFLLDDNLNDVGHTLQLRLSSLVNSVSPGATVVTSPEPNSGAKFYVVPTIKRLDQISGMFAWDDLSYVIELEWRVTDANGAVVLLDTVKGEAKGKFGTSFTAATNARRIEGEMLDKAMADSEALLKPVLSAGQAQASPPPPSKSPG
jgi:hypothetical protein